MNLLQKFSSLLVFPILMATSLHAGAGSVEGPYVIWMNLGTTNKNAVDERVKKYLDSGDDFCWQRGSSIMYMQQRPKEMTEQLVRDGLISRDRAAIRKLKKILKQEFPEAGSELDGIIVFTEHDGPRFTSITTGSGKIQSTRISSTEDQKKLGFSLCYVMPPITREP